MNSNNFNLIEENNGYSISLNNNNNKTKVLIEVYNTLGNIVFDSYDIIGNKLIIDFTDKSEGLFFIRVISPACNQTFKVLSIKNN